MIELSTRENVLDASKKHPTRYTLKECQGQILPQHQFVQLCSNFIFWGFFLFHLTSTLSHSSLRLFPLSHFLKDADCFSQILAAVRLELFRMDQLDFKLSLMLIYCYTSVDVCFSFCN